ncbi:uncharacterized protein LOC111295565 [Durio zibethinus]|uniref:Uncharacterized protein LOC111295565 n=1 Tax=Durio zibethinus TaxID=66656 RepID=A0A6P5YX30_DURZI|nr:uncharacterized protein LOC111295565 [Durio zibethinus]
MPGADSKLVGMKRSIDDLKETHEVSPKRIKMRDLDSVIRSEAATVASQYFFSKILKDFFRHSKKKVQGVITTELSFLISKEFPSNQGNDPDILRNSADGFSDDGAAEVHRARWSALFDQMDKALSQKEKQLEIWLSQIKGMQLHCDQGLQRMHWNVLYSLPQLGGSESNIRSVMGDSFDRELAKGSCCFHLFNVQFHVVKGECTLFPNLINSGT